MADETIGIDLDLSASGDGANQLRQAAAETTRLAEAQERHNRALAEAARLQQGTGRGAVPQTSGAGSASALANTAAPTRSALPYDEQMRLRDQFGTEVERQSRARAERMSQAERAHLHQQARYDRPSQAALGGGTGAQQAQHVEAEREYERLLERTRAGLEKQNEARKQRNRLEEDLRKSGHLAPEFSPEQRRTLNAQRSIAAEQESRLQQRENLNQRYGTTMGGMVHGLQQFNASAMGGIGTAGPAIAAVVGSLELFKRGLDGISGAMEIMQDRTMSAAQQHRALAESIPLVGSAVRSFHRFVDAASGTQAKLAENRYRFEYTGAVTQHRLEGDNQAAPIWRRMEEAKANYEARRFAPGKGAIHSAAPDAFADPRRYAHWEQRLPIEQQKFTTQVEIDALGRRLREEKTREGGYLSRVDELKGQHRIASRLLNEAQDKEEGSSFTGSFARRQADIDYYGQRKAEIQKELQGLQEQIAQSRAQQGSLALQTEEKRAALAKTLVDMDRQRLGVLKEQETVARQQQATFAGLTRGQQSMALRFAKQGKANFASLNPYQRQALVQAGAGEFVQRGLEQLGERDPRNREFRELTSPFGGKPAGEVSRERVELQQKINVQVVQNEEAMARAVEVALEKFGFGQIQAIFEAIKQKDRQVLERQVLQQNNAPK